MADRPPVALSRHRSELGAWESVARRAHLAAADNSFGYSGFRGVMHVRRELHLPSGAPAIVINLGEAFRVTAADSSEVSWCSSVSFMGVHARPFVTETPPERDLLVLNLTPVGARRLTGAPMAALANRWTPLRDVIGGPARALDAQLRAAKSWDARFVVLDAFILERLAEARPPRRDLARAWQWMSAGRGAAAELARGLGVSHKHLIDQFRDQVGLPPKLVARLGRFNRVLRRARAPRTDWAQTALACGYFDQAHLINEFHAFAGATPRALAGQRADFTLRAEPSG